MTRRAWAVVHRFLLRAPLPWAVFTVLIYAGAIAATAVLAPRVSNETIAWLLLVAGFTAAMTSLLDLLTQRAERGAR